MQAEEKREQRGQTAGETTCRKCASPLDKEQALRQKSKAKFVKCLVEASVSSELRESAEEWSSEKEKKGRRRRACRWRRWMRRRRRTRNENKR